MLPLKNQFHRKVLKKIQFLTGILRNLPLKTEIFSDIVELVAENETYIVSYFHIDVPGITPQDRKEEDDIEKKIPHSSCRLSGRSDERSSQPSDAQKGFLPWKYSSGLQTFFFDNQT